MTDVVNITEEIAVGPNFVYVIRINSEDAFVLTESTQVPKIVETLAKHEAKKITNPDNTSEKIYIVYSEQGSKVEISKYCPAWFGANMKTEVIIDTLKLGIARYQETVAL